MIVKHKDGSIEILLGDGKYIDYYFPKRDGEKEDFGIILTDPVLVDPDIKDEKIKEKEIYNLYNHTLCYDGTHKGQLVLGLIFHSLEEMFQVYIELKRLKYRVKIFEEDDSDFYRKTFNLKEIEEKGIPISFSCCNSILVTEVKTKNLDKYKQELLKIGLELGYRYVWGDSNLFENRTKVSETIIAEKKLIK